MYSLKSFAMFRAHNLYSHKNKMPLSRTFISFVHTVREYNNYAFTDNGFDWLEKPVNYAAGSQMTLNRSLVLQSEYVLKLQRTPEFIQLTGDVKCDRKRKIHFVGSEQMVHRRPRYLRIWP